MVPDYSQYCLRRCIVVVFNFAKTATTNWQFCHFLTCGMDCIILFFSQVSFYEAFNTTNENTLKFFRLAFLYGGFAFIISLIREAIKDVEDREGDAQYGCHTLPIYAGLRTTKVYISIWIVVLLASLVVLQLYILQFKWFFAVLYTIIFIIIPLFYLLFQLRKAKTVKDFSKLSALTKTIMLSGILSMIFFRLYF